MAPLKVLLLLLGLVVAVTAAQPDNLEALESTIQNALLSDYFERNPEKVEGRQVFEGDVVLTEAQRRASKERKGLVDSRQLWPVGENGWPVVPYRFADDQVDQVAVEAAISHWKRNTCITFTKLINSADFNQPHLKFMKETGCWSYLGRIINDGQTVSIDDGCNKVGTVVHEIGHAMGFVHEQSRIDRDEYVKIFLENVRSDQALNFDKQNTLTDISYDYSSIMQYPPKSFSKNGKATILALDPLKNYFLGRRRSLSYRDKHLVNLMYGCIDKWTSACGVSSPHCQEGGYVGSTCACVCPPNTAGQFCHTLNQDYYGPTDDGCTEEITSEGTVTSPNYPWNYPNKLKCTKVITAPECMKPRLTFRSFRLYRKTDDCTGYSRCCYFDSLEIRMNYLAPGDVFCDKDIARNQVFTGESNQMFLLFFTHTNHYPGFTADLTFVKEPGCVNNRKLTTTTKAPTTTKTPPPRCQTEIKAGKYSWSTLDAADGNSLKNIRCVFDELAGNMVTLEFIPFKLRTQVSGPCVEYVKLQTLYGKTFIWCGGRMRRKIIPIPSLHLLEYVTEGSDTNTGFNITITPGSWSDYACHETINMAAGMTYTVKTPDWKESNSRIYPKLFCEYKFIAPEGSRVQVVRFESKMRDCEGYPKQYALLNANGDRSFPRDTSLMYCSKEHLRNLLTSSNNTLVVAYLEIKKVSRGFMMEVKVV